MPCTLVFLVSIVVSIPACHAGDRGSIPRRGDEDFCWHSPTQSMAHYTWRTRRLCRRSCKCFYWFQFKPTINSGEGVNSMSGWPSGLRRCVQVAVSPGGVGSNPTSDSFWVNLMKCLNSGHYFYIVIRKESKEWVVLCQSHVQTCATHIDQIFRKRWSNCGQFSHYTS